MDAQETLKQTSTLARFAELSPDQFDAEIGKGWQAFADIRNVVAQAVQGEALTPVQGVSILACASGQIFGYAEVHGLPSPATSALQAQQQYAQQQR